MLAYYIAMDLVAKSRELDLNELVEKAKDWALLNGLSFRPDSYSSDKIQFLPFALLPSSFPRLEYEECLKLQPLVNELFHKIAQDKQFIRDSLETCARVDGFMARLLELLDETEIQKVSLGILRSDYMLVAERWTTATARCKQVEVNTIASGHGWIGTVCSRLHRYVLEEMDLMKHTPDLPKNNPLDGLCVGLYEAWKIYGKPSSVILFLLENFPTNYGDVRGQEYSLRHLDPRVRVIRRTLSQIAERGRLEGPDRRLLVDELEVAVVYMRSGYSPDQYPGPGEWGARLIIERSRAIKCPTVAYQLAGCKKMQQVLARPGVLERFLTHEDSTRMRSFFTGLYSLDTSDPGAEPALEAALRRPQDFVLKPQREGGSNNYFGEDLAKKLDQIKLSEERNGWILMDRIVPVVEQNYLVRPGATGPLRLQDVTSELGIFGVILGDESRILINDVVGHTLRTKPAECDEGGLSKGLGTCNSPILF